MIIALFCVVHLQYLASNIKLDYVDLKYACQSLFKILLLLLLTPNYEKVLITPDYMTFFYKQITLKHGLYHSKSYWLVFKPSILSCLAYLLEIIVITSLINNLHNLSVKFETFQAKNFLDSFECFIDHVKIKSINIRNYFRCLKEDFQHRMVQIVGIIKNKSNKTSKV